MNKYKRCIIPAIVLSGFIAIAIPLSMYILSLPLSQIIDEDCSDFSGYQLTNCIAFYQRQGNIEALQHYAWTSLVILWIGLCTGGVCSFLVFPRISLPRTLKLAVPFLGFFIGLLIIGLPLILFTQLILNGFIFALSLVIMFLALELALVSRTKEVVVIELASFM